MTARRWQPAFSWLDVKLGMRMMRKYPGVSLAIVFALAVGIPVSLVPNHLVDRALSESPPFDEGERVVGVIGIGPDGRTGLRVGDYERLRERVTTFAWLGAAIRVEVNVVSGDDWSEGESAALMTASSFTLARVPPMMGRVLLVADEVQGAPDVAVVGHDLWRRRLGGAPDVVGSTLRIDGVPTTIVGVMPEGFGMPRTEQIWLPLRLRAAGYADQLGPGVLMYGRLADGVSFAQAGAQLKAVGLPATPGARPGPTRAEAVAFSTIEIEEPEGVAMWVLLTIAQVMPVIVLLIACGNAAILILARTATRWGEVAVRTVLGASRARIMGQLFVETLLLALLATGVGLIALDMAVTRLTPRLDLPFWFDPGVTPALALKALGLSVLCAVVAGVLPALRATGRTLQRTLQSAATGGGTLSLGRIAGALIIVEVGLAIVALFAGGMTALVFRPAPDEHTFAPDVDRYLVASIRMGQSELVPTAGPTGDEARRIRAASLQQELGRLLASQPGVRRWTFSDQPPGEEADERLVRVDGDPALLPGVATFVDPAFFAVLEVPPVSGRLFDAGDVSLDPAAEPTAVIVNMQFLERRGLHPQRAIGARLRFTDANDSKPGPWKEIVGVVPNIEASEDRADIDGTPAVFLPATPGTLEPMTLTIDLGRRPVAFEPRLRALVAEADPTAFLSDVSALDALPAELNVFVIGIGVMTGLALLAIVLSTTALYALMSMTVAQRKREFGIRLALGGSAGGVMMTVARRALVQIAIGVTWGAGFWVAVMSWAVPLAPEGGIGETIAAWPYVLAAAAAVVIAIALAASLGPTLRYVRMRPVETLRFDG
jgi:putative ABC transport system permease protein